MRYCTAIMAHWPYELANYATVLDFILRMNLDFSFADKGTFGSCLQYRYTWR